MRIGTTRRSLKFAAGALALAGTALFAGHLTAANPSGSDGTIRGPRAYRRAVRALGLSAEQQTQIRGILRSHADEIQAQLRASRDSRRALGEAMRAQPADEASLRRLAQAMGAVKADGVVLHARIRSEIWPLLTPDQQEKAAGMQARRRQRSESRLESLDRWLRSDG